MGDDDDQGGRDGERDVMAVVTRLANARHGGRTFGGATKTPSGEGVCVKGEGVCVWWGDRRSVPEPIDRSPVGGHAEPSFLGNKYSIEYW